MASGFGFQAGGGFVPGQQPYPPSQMDDGMPPASVMPGHQGGGMYPPPDSAFPPAQQTGYPPFGAGGVPNAPGYPPAQPYPPSNPMPYGSGPTQSPYPPSQGPAGYPPQPSAYPPQDQASSPYPPQGGPAYPAQGGAYPPQDQGYPAQGGGNPAQGGAYPGAGGGYPAPGGSYPAPDGGYPAPGGGYPPQDSGYPPRGEASTPQGSYAIDPSSSSRSESKVAKSGKKMVKLHLSASKLPKMDMFSKSDPMCVIHTKAGNDAWVEFARTEQIKNNHNPMWNKTVEIEFRGQEAEQMVKFEIYDADSSSKTLKKQDFMGMVEADLYQIVNDKTFSRRLQSGKQSEAVINVQAEMLKTVTMQLSGVNLKDLDTFSKSDPFFALKYRDTYGYFKPAYTSEKIDNNLNPRWEQFSVLDSDLCPNGDYNRPLKIMVFDWDDSGSHDLIGECEVTLNSLLSAFERGSQPFELINPKKKKRTGMLRLDHLEVK